MHSQVNCNHMGAQELLADSTTTSLVSALYRGEAARLQGGFCSLSQIARGENIKKKFRRVLFEK